MTSINVLMLHGNGGAKKRFEPFLALNQESVNPLNILIPDLAGFEGRPLAKGLSNSKAYWDIFLQNVWTALSPHFQEDWIFYGHGIGGSLLLELAARDYVFPNGIRIPPKHMILNSCIGASLEKRFFPLLMRPRLVRKLMKNLISWPALRPIWEKKLFVEPDKIPLDLRKEFFKDYASCEAFGVFFDLITPAWYRDTREKVDDSLLYFWWGDQERVVASKYLELWKKDFPQAQFEVIPEWDHFPMLDDPEDFQARFQALCEKLWRESPSQLGLFHD